MAAATPSIETIARAFLRTRCVPHCVAIDRQNPSTLQNVTDDRQSTGTESSQRNVIEAYARHAARDAKALIEKSRDLQRDSTKKGDSGEQAHRELLSILLPAKYTVAEGEVTDSHGNYSRQIDAVVLTPDHPGTLLDGQVPMLVEGVNVAAEAKFDMTSTLFGKTLDKARAWGQLRAEVLQGDTAFASGGLHERFSRRPPFYAFAAEGLTIDTALEKVRDEAHTDLDALFVLDRGAMVRIDRPDESFYATHQDTGERLTGWVKLNCDGPESVMNAFMRWISIVPVDFVRQRSILSRYLL